MQSFGKRADLSLNSGYVSRSRKLSAVSTYSRADSLLRGGGSRVQGELNKDKPVAMADYLFVPTTEDNRPYLKISIYGTAMVGLLDSGATSSFVGGPGWEILKRKHISLKASSSIATVANGARINVLGSISVPVVVEDKVRVFEFLVVPDLSHKLILGSNFWKAFGIRPDLSNGQWDFCPDIVAIQDAGVLSNQQREVLDQLIADAFGTSDGRLGCTSLIEHVIETKSPPIKCRYYPVSPILQGYINEQVDQLLADGVIEPSDSGWSAPILLVKKKDNSYRFVVDFRRLNAVTERDAYPIPYISATLDKLRNAHFLSSLDIKSAYFQIPLSEGSKKFTAFTIPGKGLFQFRRLPMGLSNSPSTWQRFIDKVLGPELDPYVFVYLDDVIIVTDTWEKHMDILREVLRRLNAAGLTLNRDKCEFCKSELKYLGYIVNKHGLSVDPEKVKSMVEYPRPTTVSSVRRFIGMVSWYRKFVPNFSDIISPITALLKKKAKFNWSDSCEMAFNELKEKLVQAPILTCPDFSHPFYLHTDASGYGIGAVLTQRGEESEKVICYLSRTLSRTEKNFSPTERECLAVLWAIEKLRPYLEGTAFTVITDHHSLVWLQNLKDPQGRLARWAVRLQQYEFKIVHRKGKEHLVPDALSRAVPEEAIGCIGVEDKWFNSKFQEVQDNPEKLSAWRIEGSQLYRHIAPRDPKIDTEENRWKLVVPKGKRGAVLKEVHDDILGGHGGVKTTLGKAKQHYFWPSMKQDVQKYVRQCIICQKTKPDLQKPGGFMQSRAKEITCPWQLLSTDLIGPLPRSTRGFSYILTVVDYFSKFPLFFPLRSATAKSICQAIENHIFLVFGVPKWIVCDNGVQFRSKEFSALMNCYGVTTTFTPFYHPQANPAERTNQTIKTKLRAYVKENHRDWDILLPKVACAMRTSRNEVTTRTPFSVIFGREMPLRQNGEPIPTEGFMVDRSNGVCPWFRNMGVIVNDIRSRMLKSSSKAARIFNLRHRDAQYNVNDLVLRRNYALSDATKHFTAKLAPIFIGPFRVRKKMSPWTYELETMDRRHAGVWHSKDLRVYYDSQQNNNE